MSAAEFDDELYDQVLEVIGPGTVILTLSSKKLNRIITVDRDGVLVETERSLSRGTGPQRVPAWMIAAAWERLCDKGELSQQELLKALPGFPWVRSGRDGALGGRMAVCATPSCTAICWVW